MTKQKTIHEKWEDDGITILPPKEEKKVLKELGNPNLSKEEQNELIEKLYRGIDIKENAEDQK